MSKAHEIETAIECATGRAAFADNDSDGHHFYSVLVRGDEPEQIAPTANALRAAGFPFEIKRKRGFAGAQFLIPVHNVGTVFHADWQVGA
jgi:hypothetical protein